ncbi:MAG: methyl-accepting chemotaxis protein [Desulfobacterales bacterium]|nr:methyl-accepting chemotaxis protein [Desulfobacterales bacterium]
MRYRQSIVFKIIAATCTIVLVLMILSGYSVSYIEKKMINVLIKEYESTINHQIEKRKEELVDELKKNTEFHAKILSHVSALHLFNFSSQDLYPTLDAYMQYPEIVAIKFYDLYGKPFAAAWKDTKINIADKFPDGLKLDESLSIKKDCLFDGQPSGNFIMYYSESMYMSKIREAKKKAANELEYFRGYANSEFFKASVTQIFTAVFIIGVMVLSIIVLIRLLIFKPIDKVAKTTNRLASFDLTCKMDYTKKDEIGQLAGAINSMLESLRDIIFTLSNMAKELNTSASQISDSISNQASVSNQQSSSVSEISSTMEEFSATLSNIAENSNSVFEIADNTLKNTKEGVHSVESLMSKMNRINEDTQRHIKEIMDLRKKASEITKVMEIIGDIASQTKLIAFNASIEASSAGDTGKRFGVVASEIRRLADSVTESTNLIETKITEIQEATNHMAIASEQNNKSISETMEPFSRLVKLFDDILAGGQSTTDSVKQISLSTHQQKIAIEQIVVGLRDIEKGSKETSFSINNIKSITEKLSTLSSNLKTNMEKFVLN